MTPAAALWTRILAEPADADLKSQYVAALAAEGNPRAQLYSLWPEYEQLRARFFVDKAAEVKAEIDRLTQLVRDDYVPIANRWGAEIRLPGGWPVEIAISAEAFARNAAEIVATIPLRHLDLTSVSDRPAVFDVPQLDQIASIDGSKQVWRDGAIGALAGSSHLGALRWLNLSRADISEAQVDMLAASPALRGVCMLDLTDNPTRDPVDAAAGYGVYWETNRIITDSIFLPAFGTELEKKYGKIAWLHGLDNYLEAYPPSRYSF